MAPEARMTIAAVLFLFFGGIAAGSLNTAHHAWRWRDAQFVRGVLVKQGTAHHFEYTPPGQPRVAGPTFRDDSTDQPDGIVDDHASLEYDPNLPEKLRPHTSKGKPSTNRKYFVMTASAGAGFGLAALIALWSFFRALYDKLHPET
jgi:hypothetical protein